MIKLKDGFVIMNGKKAAHSLEIVKFVMMYERMKRKFKQFDDELKVIEAMEKSTKIKFEPVDKAHWTEKRAAYKRRLKLMEKMVAKYIEENEVLED